MSEAEKSKGISSLPGASFVKEIDALLKKDCMEKAIPEEWLKNPPLGNDFKPRHIVDIGGGLGGFTRSVLKACEMWGLVENLEKITIIDGDKDLFNDGSGHSEKALEEVKTRIGETTKRKVEINYIQENVDFKTLRTGVLREVKADLLIASHVIYYFQNDSEKFKFFEHLIENNLNDGGRLWAVIRKAESPIYKARAKMIQSLGRVDPRENDYSEYFVTNFRNATKKIKLITKAKHKYELNLEKEEKTKAICLLMWGNLPNECGEQEMSFVEELLQEDGPLFLEDHLLLGARLENWKSGCQDHEDTKLGFWKQVVDEGKLCDKCLKAIGSQTIEKIWDDVKAKDKEEKEKLLSKEWDYFIGLFEKTIEYASFVVSVIRLAENDHEKGVFQGIQSSDLSAFKALSFENRLIWLDRGKALAESIGRFLWLFSDYTGIFPSIKVSERGVGVGEAFLDIKAWRYFFADDLRMDSEENKNSDNKKVKTDPEKWKRVGWSDEHDRVKWSMSATANKTSDYNKDQLFGDAVPTLPSFSIWEELYTKREGEKIAGYVKENEKWEFVAISNRDPKIVDWNSSALSITCFPYFFWFKPMVLSEMKLEENTGALVFSFTIVPGKLHLKHSFGAFAFCNVIIGGLNDEQKSPDFMRGLCQRIWERLEFIKLPMLRHIAYESQNREEKQRKELDQRVRTLDTITPYVNKINESITRLQSQVQLVNIHTGSDSQTLFKAYPLVSPLFRDNEEIQLGASWILKINHNIGYLEEESFAPPIILSLVLKAFRGVDFKHQLENGQSLLLDSDYFNSELRESAAMLFLKEELVYWEKFMVSESTNIRNFAKSVGCLMIGSDANPGEINDYNDFFKRRLFQADSPGNAKRALENIKDRYTRVLKFGFNFSIRPHQLLPYIKIDHTSIAKWEINSSEEKLWIPDPFPSHGPVVKFLNYLQNRIQSKINRENLSCEFPGFRLEKNKEYIEVRTNLEFGFCFSENMNGIVCDANNEIERIKNGHWLFDSIGFDGGDETHEIRNLIRSIPLGDVKLSALSFKYDKKSGGVVRMLFKERVVFEISNHWIRMYVLDENYLAGTK